MEPDIREHRSVRRIALACDDPSDVRSMPVLVDKGVTVPLERGEIDMPQGRWKLEIFVASEMRVRSVDSRIHDGPDDVATAGGVDPPGDIDHDGRDRLVAHVKFAEGSRATLGLRPARTQPR